MTSRDEPPYLIWAGVLLALGLAMVLACVLATGLGAWFFQLSPSQSPADINRPPVASPAVIPPEAGSEIAPQVGATPLSAAHSSVYELAGIASDIPIPQNVRLTGLVGAPDSFSYLMDLSYPATLGYYQRAMTDRGWTRVDYGTRIGRSGAELQYEKGDRKLTIRIATVDFVGTVVEIVTRDQSL